MDSIMATLRNFSVTSAALEATLPKKQVDLQLRDQAVVVKQFLATNREAIRANFEPITTQLDPKTDTIPLLGILQIALDPSTSNNENRALVSNRILEFLLGFNPYHVRYVGSSLRSLLEYILFGGIFTAKVAVEAVASAMLRLDPSGSMFTSTHLLLAKFAYEQGYIEPALKVLDCDITYYPGMSGQKDPRILFDEEIPPSSYISVDTGLTDVVKSSTVLEYNLVCGLCHTARRDWAKAQKAFERVVTHPTRDKGLSQIMIDAYKRWLLVGLLKDGREPTLPAYTSPSAKSSYLTLTTPYQSVAAQFSTINVSQFKGGIETNRAVWEEDDTMSLIMEVIAAYQKWQILSVRGVFSQISIAQIRTLTFSAETGEPLRDDQQVIDLVRSMIESNMLKGELQLGSSGEDTYLTFQDETSSLSEVEFAREVAECHRNIETLGTKYRAANERLSSSRDYVRHVFREQRRAEKEGPDAGLGFDSQVEDEDLMTGIIATT